MVSYQSVPGGSGGAWDTAAARDRPQGKNADLKFVIITLIRRNNDNNDDDNNNPLKVVCTQSLLHNEQTQAIFKHKTQKNIQNTNRGKTPRPGNQDKQIILMQSKMKHSGQRRNTTGQKARTAWSTQWKSIRQTIQSENRAPASRLKHGMYL